MRGSIILENGKLLFPPPPITPSPVQQTAAPVPQAKKEVEAINPFNATLKDSLLCTAGMSNVILYNR